MRYIFKSHKTKKTASKALNMLLIVMVLISMFPPSTYALELPQLATPSAIQSLISPTPQISPPPSNPNDILSGFYGPRLTNKQIFDESEFTKLRSSIVVGESLKNLTNSAQFNLLETKKRRANIKGLSKKTYNSNEKVPIVIENDDPENVKVEVFNSDGEEIPVNIDNEIISETAMITISPPDHFEPGRYNLKITDSAGNITTQDFSWGVLTVNTNKSIYLPNEEAKLSLAVLDEMGNMVCDAQVNLQIKSPTGETMEFKTANASSSASNSIKVNPQCYKKEFTTVPDYEALYPIGGATGIYEMFLTALTSNGTYSVTDSFEVRDFVPFDVERISNTRIYPPVTYPVKFNITANEDFTGEISEVVPEKFIIGGIDTLQPFLITTKSEDVTVSKPKAQLEKPFFGEFRTTQGFGVEETDPIMAEKYRQFDLLGHDGVDYALPVGTPVLATANGIVVRAKQNSDYGTTIVIQHSWGKSYYGHLDRMAKIEGDLVKKGEVIGYSGNTGLSTGPHLHFGIKLINNDLDNGYYGKINPMPYFTDATVLGEKTTSINDDPKIMRNDTSDGVHIITWNVDIKKGDKIELGYTYKAPLDSPEFYTLGPLEFIQTTNSASTSGNLVFKEARTWNIAADAVSNSGTVIYSDMADVDYDQMDFRTYTSPTTLGAETESVNFDDNSAVSQVKIVSSPTRDEKIVAIQHDNGILNIMSCTGGCDAGGDWTHIATQSAVTTDAGAETFRPWDIAYEQLSGLFTIVFYETGQTGELYYCQWDGTNWSPTTECDDSGSRPAVFAPGAGNNIDLDAILGSTVVEWVRLVPRGERLTKYRTDEFLLGASDTGDDLFLAHWTGSAWEDQTNPLDDMSAQNAQKFDIAWEETTGEGLAVVTDDGVANLRYVIYDGTGWGTLQTSAEANNGGQAFNSWVDLASDPVTDDIAIFVMDSGADVELFYWDGSALDDQDATDDITAEANTGQHAQVEWTRFTSEAVFVYTDSNVLTSDMQCWQTGGGNFTAVISDIGNPNISNGDDVDDAVLVGSPNSDRMLMSRRGIDTTATTGDDVEVLTYDGAGCADTDWVTVGEASARGEGLNQANSIGKTHGLNYTAYSPWSLNWRFYDDETSDDPSTGLNNAAENTTPTDVDLDEFIRLRINMSERSGMSQSDTRKILQYAAGSDTCTPNTIEQDPDCTWTDVGDTSETSAVWRYATSLETCTACTDGNTSNTPRLTDTTAGDPEVFYVSDKDNATDTDFDHTALTIKEIDFPLKAEAVTGGTTYYFRLYEPRISSNGQDSPVYREQDDDGNNDCASSTCTYPSLVITPDGPTNEQILRHGAWFLNGLEKPFVF